VEITDLMGRLIKKSAVKGVSSSINMGDIKGVYIVRLLMSQGSYSQKVCLK